MKNNQSPLIAKEDISRTPTPTLSNKRSPISQWVHLWEGYWVHPTIWLRKFTELLLCRDVNWSNTRAIKYMPPKRNALFAFNRAVNPLSDQKTTSVIGLHQPTNRPSVLLAKGKLCSATELQPWFKICPANVTWSSRLFRQLYFAPVWLVFPKGIWDLWNQAVQGDLRDGANCSRISGLCVLGNREPYGDIRISNQLIQILYTILCSYVLWLGGSSYVSITLSIFHHFTVVVFPLHKKRS